MKCRGLERNQKTGYQTVIWFGSSGKNVDYVPNEFQIENGLPYILVNGSQKPWYVAYSDYWVLNGAPYQNASPDWDPELSYFLKRDDGVYESVLEKPENWKDSYSDYWVADFEPNANPSYNPSIVYYSHDNKIPAENYSTEARGVRDSLIQRLSVIKGELWYKASYGLPLMEKIKNKGIYDSIIINMITEHPDIKRLVDFDSSFDKKTRAYTFEFVAETVYAEEVRIAYTI